MRFNVTFTLCTLDGEELCNLQEAVPFESLGEELPRIVEDLLEDCCKEDFDALPQNVQNFYNFCANGSPVYFRNFVTDSEEEDTVNIYCETATKEIFRGDSIDALGLIIEISKLDMAKALISQVSNSLATNGNIW